jgi:ketosteroid isomerase-like protein
MTCANLDLVRSIYADWERGDFHSVVWADPDIEWVTADGPTPGRATGMDGLAAAFRHTVATWKDFHIEADEFIELDADRVLVLVHYGGRGKASGLDLGHVGSQAAAVLHIHDGMVTRYATWWDRDRALADLGLAPEGGPA